MCKTAKALKSRWKFSQTQKKKNQPQAISKFKRQVSFSFFSHFPWISVDSTKTQTHGWDTTSSVNAG